MALQRHLAGCRLSAMRCKAVLLALAFIVGPAIAQIPPKVAAALTQVPDWEVQIQISYLPIQRGNYSIWSLKIAERAKRPDGSYWLNSDGTHHMQAIYAPDGHELKAADVELRFEGAGSSNFHTDGWCAYHSFTICADDNPGPDATTLVIVYPKTGSAALPPVPGYAFTARTPITRAAQGKPNTIWTVLKLEGVRPPVTRKPPPTGTKHTP